MNKPKTHHAKFLNGSILQHVARMSVANAIGLTALFLVDLVDIYFISLLGDHTYIAAIGYASGLMFFTTSISIALVTVNSALVAKSIGKKSLKQPARYASNILLFSFLVTSTLATILWFLAPLLLQKIGANDHVLEEATAYLRIIVPALPILAVGMQMNATLRSFGDAKHAMFATLGGGLINALLDPLFIFAFKLDLQGAAIASVISRFTVLFVGFYYVHTLHKIKFQFNLKHFKADCPTLTRIAIPATLTQIAPPLSSIYVTYEVAKFGVEYVAGWAITGRIMPVAFGMMFAMSGAIGPILSQNYGALNFSRVRETLNQSFKFLISYTLVMALILFLMQDIIISAFSLTGHAAEILRLFLHVVAPTFAFSGCLFVAMAFLNNLGLAKYATILNIGKMTLGTIPFVTIGALYYGAPGILYGQAFGGVIFGIVALLLSNNVMNKLELRNKESSFNDN